MAKDFDTMEDSNRSANPSIHEVSDPKRRILLRGGSAAVAALLAPLAGCGAFKATLDQNLALLQRGPKLGFKGIPPGVGDKLVVPPGYVATALAAWGEPIGIPGNMPAFRFDAPTAPPSRRCRWACTMTALANISRSRAVQPRADRAQPRIHRRRPAARGRLQRT
jgi:hypothetical protein